ncbi:MAG TPA: alanine racemase [Solirubrobacteraceae bacterium]|jgi:alanine racemase/UDP-N-acetylmuramoyl-tripeptide--D-alanyl-D-alanine ligase|nr:alanine racemase [Solirubrobacteraceae bacterium]
MEPLAGSIFRDIVAGAELNGAPAPDASIHHLSTHSRRINRGSAFFAIAGERADGHDFAAEALENGAAVVVVRTGAGAERDVQSGRAIEVDDPLKALQRLASWWRTRIEGRVVAVVGSNGKTITKDALAHLLADGRRVYASPGSYNSKLGVPLALLGAPRDCETAILELAATEPGEMAVLAKMVKPDHVVMTNLGARWRSNFEDREHQARELLECCGELPESGWLLLGEDDEEIRGATERFEIPRRLVRGEGMELPSFRQARPVQDGLEVGVDFPPHARGPVENATASTRLTVHTPSEEILSDVELAMGAASLLGVPTAELIAAVQDYVPSATRMETWRSPSGVTLIRDVATPDPIALGAGVRAARRAAGAGGQMVVVLAERLELVDEDTVRELAHALGAERVDGVYALRGPLPEALAQAAGAREGSGVPVHLFKSGGELRARLLEALGAGDVALVQSPRTAALGELAAELIGAMAPTRLYLDLAAIEQNVSTFRRIVGPNVRVLAVIKALGYGTDSAEMAACLQDAGVDYLAVSNADEGVALRRAGVSAPILVMLGTARDLREMLRHELTPVIYSQEMLDGVLELARQAERPPAVHVKVDSGMHRTGFSPERASEVIALLHGSEHVRVEGIMTHLACADEPSEDEFTRSQLAAFEGVLEAAEQAGVRGAIAHAAATAATIRLPESHFDMVRIGLGLHGVHPSPATAEQAELVPAFGLVSRIVEVLELSEGDRIGYGGSYRVPAGGARVGVIPAGYHDCVPRAFSNVGHVIVAGVRCPILGRVSMDSMTVDLSGCEDARVGSDVLILGRYGDWLVSPEELAAKIGTIPYELMVRVGPRVQRIFTRH